MREYGRERLTGQRLNRLRRAHAEQFARLASSTARDIFGPEHLSDVRDLDRHFDELRAAHRWGLDHDIAVGAELVGGLTLYVEHTMSAEVMEWAQQTLEAATAAKVPALSGVLAVAAAAARFQGALTDAEGLVGEGLARGAAPATEGYLRYMLLEVSLLDGRIDDASRHVGELVALAEREGLTSLARMVGLAWQFVVANDGDPQTAVAAAERIQVDAEASGETIIANWAVHVQGKALIDTDPVRAGALLEDALRRARESGDRYLQGVALVAAASVRTRHGDPAEAAPLFLAVVDHWRDSGIWTQQWTTLRNVVDLLVRLQRDQPAAVLLGALSSRRTSAAGFRADAERMAAEVEMLTERLGSEAFGALRDQGATMDDDEVVAVARRALVHLVSAAGGRSGRS
jgi:ATP/maltotriose-dependent transcriptional regulator MalT